MLEEILKNINTNLERIAKAQEESNELYKNFIECETAEVEATKTPITVEQPTVTKIEQNPTDVVYANPQTAIPQTAVPQESMPQAIPTTQVVESFTIDQLAVAMSNAVSAGKMNIIQGILQQFGVQALTQINPADYNKVAILLKENGVEV